jgi:hypothetical protein
MGDLNHPIFIYDMFYYCQSSYFSFAYVIYFTLFFYYVYTREYFACFISFIEMIIGARLVELLLVFFPRSVINSNIIIKEEKKHERATEIETERKEKGRRR